MLGRKAVFGRHGRSRVAPAPILRAQADDDGIARVLPRMLWEDSRTGEFLRALGLDPDDSQNVLPDPHDFYRERFAEARIALDRRIEALAAAHREQAPEARFTAFLLIDLPSWRGRFGTMLVEQLGLVAWDEWNVILLAADEATAGATGIPLHPGSVPALNVRVTEALDRLHRQLEADLAEVCPSGCATAGTERARCIAIEADARDRLLDFIAICGNQVEALIADRPD